MALISKESLEGRTLKVCDPFAGDGRLIYWLLQEWVTSRLPQVKWEIHLWDINESGLQEAIKRLNLLKRKGVMLEVHKLHQDAFRIASEYRSSFDIVFTNPPWELLKPDSRELRHLSGVDRDLYIQSLREYDQFLRDQFPISQPLKKFAGWGTNLSRVGLEASFEIAKINGWILIVLPASFFADDQSIELRKLLFKRTKIFEIAYYPAEAKLFGMADVSSSTSIFQKSEERAKTFRLTLYNRSLAIEADDNIAIDEKILNSNGYSIPISIGPKVTKIINKLSARFDSWGVIEKKGLDGLWAGREIDETGSVAWLTEIGTGAKFIKGKMVDRFKIKHEPNLRVSKLGWRAPDSVSFEKIVWRDVSRPNQKRRLIATIVEENIVAGNSLGVCYYKDGNKDALRILLAIMNSLCFEFQLKTYLATGHVSLSAIRRVSIPSRDQFSGYPNILKLTKSLLNGDRSAEYKIEALIAKEVYDLTASELELMLESFQKLTKEERNAIMTEFLKKEDNASSSSDSSKVNIPNHFTSRLSDLDLQIINSVPPGGNWKNIPTDVPSQRIKQIRESYAEGKGSRSTYYGRLLGNKPAYTINTYFNRPGNGCHIHYHQDRVLSQREAARLQSFPDSFVFFGSQNSINTQIGNAVPPLLAYQIALEITRTIGETGQYVDLFSGAGGMGLGFKWAGWQPIVANDIEASFLDTYSENVHSRTVPGSITNSLIFEDLVNQTIKGRNRQSKMPLWILGGPPCQGFSTAGNRRTMDDERNHLFVNYTQFLKEVQPDGFVFENVAGLLSMENGDIFKRVKMAFENVMPQIKGFVLNSENYAIPQRRKRVFLIGLRARRNEIKPPRVLTSLNESSDLFNVYSNCVSVEDALSDLPKLIPGQNGSSLDYLSQPKTIYQSLMRGQITPLEYLESFKNYL